MAEVGPATTAGLDLLGILAEEVDWNSQQAGTPNAVPLAALGHTQESCNEAKQKLWAGHILGGLGVFKADQSPHVFSHLNASMPLKSQHSEVHFKVCQVAPTKASRMPSMESAMDDPLNTMILTKRTALFYENLYERLCPGIVPRAYIYPELGRKSHHHDPTFAGLVLSISLLGLLGLRLSTSSVERQADSESTGELQNSFVMPCASHDWCDRIGQDSAELRAEATRLVERILSLRLSASGGGICFGQAPTLETVLTSFFLSIALYNFDDTKHEGDMPSITGWKDASFFRFCEAVTLAQILGLGQGQAESGSACSSAAGCDDGAFVEEVKIWSLLVRAERWWSEQKPGYVCQLEVVPRATRKRQDRDYDENHADARRLKRGTRARVKGPKAFDFVVKLGFKKIRDDLLYRFGDLIDCWTYHCDSRACRKLTAKAVLDIHDSLSSFELSSRVHIVADPILVDLTRQTLCSKLWIASLHHNLISSQDSQAFLRPDQLLHIALDTLDLLEDLDQLVLCSLHSSGATAKTVQLALQEIRDCVATLPDAKFGEDSFSFEQIRESDDDNSRESGERDADDGKTSNLTTISKAAQSVMENLDQFLRRLETHWRPPTSSS